MENHLKEYSLKMKCFVFFFFFSFFFFLTIINHEKMVATGRNVVQYNYMKAKTERSLWIKSVVFGSHLSLN